MPASTLDPVNAAIRSSLSKTSTETNLDIQLAGATKKALLADIEFEPAGSYQSSVLDKLKTKYIVLKSSESSQQTSSNTEKMGADETLALAKHELYPLEAVQLGWSNTEWVVGAGMVNMGNTCYLNSTLQALFHVPALVNWLVSDKQHMSQCEDSGGLCIICAMRKTLQDSQQRNTNSIRPFLIYNKLRVVCRNLIPGRQEDAHEFLRYLVEAMEKAYLSRFKNHSEFDSRTKETTPLNQILGGYLRSAVRCLECGHVSTTFQHFQDLLLDIRKAQTLEEALDGYFSREKLDDESYHCESCQKKVPATKQFTLERTPMVLCVQLKRFSVSNNKITKHIQFRQRLELTKYTRHRPSAPLIYRFVALVTHMGPTVGCGHYTAVAQAPCGNYYQFDDSMVRPISHQAVFNTNAYIMLYELECPPFSSQKSQNNGTTATAKTKSATAVNSNNCVSSSSSSASSSNSNNGDAGCTSGSNSNQPENSQENKSILGNKLQLNGSRVLYGPELPPKLDTLMTTATATSATKSAVTTAKSVLFEHNGVVSSSGGSSFSVTNCSNNNNNNNNNKAGDKLIKMNGNSFNQETSSPSSPASSSSSDSDFEHNPKQTTLPIKEKGCRTNITVVTVPGVPNAQTCQTGQKSPKSPSSVSCRPSSKLVNNSSEESSSLLSSKLCAGSSDSSSRKCGGDNSKITESFSTVSASVKRKNDSSTKGTAVTTPSTMTATQTITKLVPYDVDDDDEDDGDVDEDEDDPDEEEDNEDDEGNSSISSGGTVCSFVESEVMNDSNPSRNGDPMATAVVAAATATNTKVLSADSRVSTKATIGDWQVTSSLDRNAHGPSNEGRSWDKKIKTPHQKEEKHVVGAINTTAIGELLKMSHGGYAGPVNSWSGSRAELDRELAEERREDRKRSLCDNSDRGRIKHLKTINSSSNYKSNPGYNRIQEFHNAKNSWSLNNNSNGSSSYSGSSSNGRQFYNTSGKHRNRRNNNNFHHKNNYHKNNYTFRQ